MAQRDPALDAFDKLCLREVEAEDGDTVSTFLAEFQSTAASLKPDERIKLVYAHESMKLLKAVLADLQASKVCALRWVYTEKEDVHSIVPLLINSCPELASIWVYFYHHSGFDFVSSMLEHPRNKVKVLEMPEDFVGDFPRFFAALGQSHVSALNLTSDGSPEFARGLCEYLAKDLLVRLKVSMNWKQVPPELMMSLAKCTRLAELELFCCAFSQPAAFPQFVTKLVLDNCLFVGGEDWSFLVGSSVRELDFALVREVDGNQLGSALAVHLRAKGLEKLRLSICDFSNDTLAAIGLEIGRIKRLHLEDSYMDDTSVELIVLTLQSPSNALQELKLGYTDGTMRGIETQLVPALRHPNCNLAKLSFWVDEEHKATANAVENRFHSRRSLFVLLQGQQVRRLYCPLRRLPVEMFRLVGMVLL